MKFWLSAHFADAKAFFASAQQQLQRTITGGAGAAASRHGSSGDLDDALSFVPPRENLPRDGGRGKERRRSGDRAAELRQQHGRAEPSAAAASATSDASAAAASFSSASAPASPSQRRVAADSRAAPPPESPVAAATRDAQRRLAELRAGAVDGAAPSQAAAGAAAVEDGFSPRHRSSGVGADARALIVQVRGVARVHHQLCSPTSAWFTCMGMSAKSSPVAVESKMMSAAVPLPICSFHSDGADLLLLTPDCLEIVSTSIAGKGSPGANQIRQLRPGLGSGGRLASCDAPRRRIIDPCIAACRILARVLCSAAVASSSAAAVAKE